MQNKQTAVASLRKTIAQEPIDSWLCFIALTLILLPKVNLISVTGQTSGIRLDDMVLLLISPYLLIRARDSAGLLLSVRLYLAFVLTTFLSASWNIDSNGWKLFLYPLRLAEYTAFLILGSFCLNRKNMTTGVVLFICLNTAASVGQMFFDWGGFPRSIYSENVGERAIGLTAGPWELAATINLALGYLCYAWGGNQRHMARFLPIYLITLVCTILSGSRVGIVANTLILVYYFATLDARPIRKWGGLGVSLLITYLIFSALPNSLHERSQTLMGEKNLDQIGLIGSTKDCQKRVAGGELDYAVDDNGRVDPSWGVRTKKWATAACVYKQDLSNFVLGVGPGFFGPALDGGFLRVLFENGVIGALLLLTSLAGGDAAFRRYRLLAMVFAAHMVFIDIYLSYKFTSLLLFMLGALHTARHSNGSKHDAAVH
jgi:hypothetical protein